jgi:hypothetical protein
MGNTAHRCNPLSYFRCMAYKLKHKKQYHYLIIRGNKIVGHCYRRTDFIWFVRVGNSSPYAFLNGWHDSAEEAFSAFVQHKKMDDNKG